MAGSGQKISATPAGLYLEPNNLSQVPDGALEQADNVVISRDGIVEPMRGQQTAYSLAGGFDLLYEAPPGYAAGGVWARPTGASALYYFADGSRGTPTSLTGTNPLIDDVSARVTPPVGCVFGMPGVTFNGFLYGSGDKGVWKATNAAVSRAGMPPGLDMTYTLSAAGTPTALATGFQVAYRVIWLRAQGAGYIRGAPSTRLVATNAAGATRDVVLTITVPQAGLSSGWGVQSGDVYQVYRSAASPNGTPPTDELSLCFEGTYTSGATVSVTDTSIDTLLGAALYTNASQDSSLKPNDQPPTCWDMESYRGVMFYANTVECYVDAQVIATGTGALDVGSTITIASVTITGAAVENVGALQFLVDTASPNLSDRWANTAASIIRVFNRNAASASAYAVSADLATGIPGRIRFTSKDSRTLSVTSTAPAAAFKITNPANADGNNVYHPNRVYWSKPQTPEAVPALNYADVGSSDGAIAQIIATRDCVFIFKEEGLWRLSGDAEPWDIRPFDPTCRLVAPRTAVVLDNTVVAFTNQGVVRVSDTGVSVLSRPIETALQSYIANGASMDPFAVAYESDRKYLIWLSASGPAFVYDIFTQAWTARTDSATAGVVAPLTNDLVLATTSSLTSERKTLTDADHAGPAGALACAVKWSPQFATPGMKQQFKEVGLLFRKLGGSVVSLAFTSDLVTSPATVPVTLSDYGTPPFSPFTVRTYVPLEQSRGSQLSVTFSQSVNGTTFQLQGLALSYRTTGEEAGL